MIDKDCVPKTDKETGDKFSTKDCTSTKKPCDLHVFFHGEGMSGDEVFEKSIKYSGFLEWAATNHMIVLFPQAKADRWGVDWNTFEDANNDKNKGSKEGKQEKAIRRMVERI